MSPVLRAATAADLPAINAIYNHYVLHSTCTYQTEPSTAEERAQWFAAHGPAHPVLVMEEGGAVIGWGSLSRFHPREGYRHSVEDSIYLHHAHHGRGLGRLMLSELVRLAGELGYHTILGGISSDQPASLALHKSLGFTQVAQFREVGFKHDRWLDVVWMQKMLAPAAREG